MGAIIMFIYVSVLATASGIYYAIKEYKERKTYENEAE